MNHFNVLLIAAIVFLICGCDKAYKVKNDIPFRTQMSNQDCINRSINVVSGVELIKSTGPVSFFCISDCGSIVFSSVYKVLNTKEEIIANVELFRDRNGKFDLKNSVYRRLNDFLGDDRLIIEKALSDVSASISKYCGETH